MKFIRVMALILCLVLVCACLFSLMSCGDNSGDGKSSCKACGRSPVYDLGYCKRCYKSFMDFTYGD